jgi:TolB protein
LSKDENAELYTIDDKGRDLKRLTHDPAIDTSPTWSPGGDQIAFTSDRSGTPQIYVMGADGGNVRRVTYHNRYSDSPAWSPDGQWIAYVARWEDTIELRIMRPDGMRQRVIVDTGLNDTPSWARDSRHIAYSSLRGGKRAVYVVDIFTGLERRLTMGSENAITPAWSQD